jgi:hypothetical protein
MCQYSAKDGHMTMWHYAHLGGIIQRGPGLVLTEAIAVTPEGSLMACRLAAYYWINLTYFLPAKQDASRRKTAVCGGTHRQRRWRQPSSSRTLKA